MSQKPTISDLLALRDGEPLTADARQAIVEDPQSADRLSHLLRIKVALSNLPDEQPDDAVWERIQAQMAGSQSQPLFGSGAPSESAPSESAPAEGAPTEDVPTENGPTTRSWQMPYPMATAAGVFCAAVLVSLLWLPELVDPGAADGPGPMPQVAVGTAPQGVQLNPGATVNPDSMAALIDRSQQLEAVARLPVARAVDGPERSRQALLYRIADLDSQLNSLIEEEPMNPELKEKLWRQRVDLLETLVTVQQEQLSASPELH